MKKAISFFLCFLILFATVGCNSFHEMNQEQEDQIVNYAADIALKYDANYEKRLVDLSLYEENKVPVESEPEEEKETGMDPVVDTDIIDVSEESGYHSSMEEFFGVEGVSIEFIDSYFADSYPKDGAKDYYFTLEATEGKTLLIMKFKVSNVTNQNINVDFFAVAPKLRISLNGGGSVGTLSTMLMDDLSTYKETMANGEAVELVLLAEISKDKATEIETIDITMRSDSGTAKISLK